MKNMKKSPINSSENACFRTSCLYFRMTSCDHICDYYNKVLQSNVNCATFRLKECSSTDPVWVEFWEGVYTNKRKNV